MVKMQDRLIVPKEAAYLLGISTQSLANARCTGTIDLKFKKVGCRIRYSLADINNYIERNTYASTSKKL